MTDSLNHEQAPVEHTLLRDAVQKIFRAHSYTCGILIQPNNSQGEAGDGIHFALQSDPIPGAGYSLRMWAEPGPDTMTGDFSVSYVEPSESDPLFEAELVKYFVTPKRIMRYWADGADFDSGTVQELREDVEAATWSEAASQNCAEESQKDINSAPPLL
jgi:hypothetical protein